MAKTDPNESPEQGASEPKKDSPVVETSSKRDRHKKSSRRRHHTSSDEQDSSSSSDSGEERRRSRSKKRRRSRSLHRRSRKSSDESESESEEGSSSDFEEESELESESERRRERRKRREKEERRRKEKDRERRKKKKEKEEKRKKDEKKRKEKEKKKEKKTGKTGAVTDSWGKYGIIREIDMWNKRPEFTAWLAEVKQVNLESLSNWEEKQMFQAFMEDHNTATFPSKKYYDLEAFHRRQLEKEMKKGLKKAQAGERTVFDDEEQRRIELLKERERQKEEEVEALKRSMQSGMAQAMKEQARLREEMMYQYRLGNFEAAAAIQKRLDPDAPM